VVLFLRSFDEADMAALAAYLSRQQCVAGSPDHMLGNGVVVN
jgi:cytochrome c553